jgi:hypothetical protein
LSTSTSREDRFIEVVYASGEKRGRKGRWKAELKVEMGRS